MHSAIVWTRVLPVVLRYQTELAAAVSAAQSAGVDFEDTWAQLQEFVGLVDELRAAADVIGVEEVKSHPDSERMAIHIRDVVIPAMERARRAADALESQMPADQWPLPTYAEMLFER